MKIKSKLTLSFLIKSGLLIAFFTGFLWAEPQDPPDFTDHELPMDDRPAPRAWEMGLVDMGVLFLALSLTSFLVLKKRSRKGIFWLSLFSLGYFGFFREGCVCPIGSIQNIAQAVFSPNYVAPLVVIFFFFAPLIYSALFGRSYCASVCPHGAIQDAVLIKPIQVPTWIDHGLGFLPFIYLGLGVLFAATGSAYIICDYDPFIAIFRLSGNANMLGLGALFLIAGMFIGRPYCRYMCPYGVLLRIFSHVSKYQVKIYPDRCIDCSLCDYSCPFDAIRKTTPEHQKVDPKKGKKRFVSLLVLAPFVIVLMGYLTSLMSPYLAKVNEKVSLAYEIEEQEMLLEKGVPLQEIVRSEESETWRDRYDDPEALFVEANVILDQFKIGAWALGIWIGLVMMVKLIKLNTHRVRNEYEADRGSCYSCGRCYDYCPGSNGIPLQFKTGGHLRQ